MLSIPFRIPGVAVPPLSSTPIIENFQFLSGFQEYCVVAAHVDVANDFQFLSGFQL